MPTWVKVLLVVAIVGFVGVAVAVVLAARWVKSQGAELQKQGKVIMAEAQQFGRGKPARACVDEALTRVRACDGMMCEAKTKIFLQHCLKTADVPADFCNGIPASTEIIKSAQWQMAECTRRGLPDDQPCIRLIGALQVHCDR